ncbi:ABC transporter substrate-binding protein [Amorphus orientalis]|uniref:Spermidine/putrescine transport system substrate-binding protein/spermidine/putrescine transport system substrate-binding protein n=1 Tax=Amorphus orientalis TaxID=649198 RepID=A0AAE3VT18_9HYPH|nr:extracellular solute-binding protein [Amorphus orientalis]MDQ0317433.1 putative spermidine/putrescine transport system substrate-binding protein/spermidine/putrescine transport system substrate-binding protein [Amorphus orientalis]
MTQFRTVPRRIPKGRRLLAAGAMALTVSATSVSAQELNILTWEGYAEDAWIDQFEEEFGITVNPTYVGSNDEYMAALAAGDSQYDSVVIVSSLAQPAIKAGFVEPLDLSKIPNFENVSPEFRRIAFLKDGDTQYGAPYFWDIQPVTYLADEVEECSFEVLFDEKYKGKIAMWDDVSTIGDVASYMGFEDIWNLSDDQLEQVKQKMIEQKPLIRRYWSTGGEIIELMTSGEVVATNSWSYVTEALKDEGVNAAQCAPARPTAWLDSLFIVKGTEHPELVHEFINFMLRPDIAAKVYDVSGFSFTVREAEEHLPDGALEGTNLAKGPEFVENLSFWGEIPRRSRYLEVWNEVKAATVE